MLGQDASARRRPLSGEAAAGIAGAIAQAPDKRRSEWRAALWQAGACGPLRGGQDALRISDVQRAPPHRGSSTP